MIIRQNWLDTNRFLSYQEKVRQNDPATIKRQRIALRHLLEWADDVSLGNVTRKEPTFPAYLINKRFSPAGLSKTLQIVSQFYKFAASEWSGRYKSINNNWIRSLVPSRRNSEKSRLKKHSFYAFDDVLKVAKLFYTAKTIEVKRDSAAVCFLFLSGMRIGAFTSLPIECVNIADNEIYQDPEKGVATKNRKAAVTHLLQVPELLEVVQAWDKIVNDRLSPLDYWYPVMNSGTDDFKKNVIYTLNRRGSFSEGLREICNLAGIPYLSPHKIRHGHVVYAMKNVKDLAGLKAISQNIMHSSIQITDSIYGNFSKDEVKRIISTINGSEPVQSGQGNESAVLGLLSLLLKDNPEAQKLLSQLKESK